MKQHAAHRPSGKNPTDDDTTAPVLDIVLICGAAGAGKTTASDALEDQGYFCVDNLPVKLLSPLLDFSLASGGQLKNLCLVSSILDEQDSQELLQVLQKLRFGRHRVQLLFLQAKSAVLMRRFSQTRRPHPFDQNRGELESAIQNEARTLASLRQAADQIIDTSDLKSNQLRAEIMTRFSGHDSQKLVFALQSFGFKYGVPRDLNFLFDARFLPNPYFVPELKDKTGRDRAVADYVLQCDEAQDFLAHIKELLLTMRPLYQTKQTRYVAVAIACTGGRHRSVALVEALHTTLSSAGLSLSPTRHRDIDK